MCKEKRKGRTESPNLRAIYHGTKKKGRKGKLQIPKQEKGNTSNLLLVNSLPRTKQKERNRTSKEGKVECDKKLGEEKRRATMVHKGYSKEERERRSS